MFPSESPHEEAGLYPAPICFSFKEVEDDMALQRAGVILGSLGGHGRVCLGHLQEGWRQRSRASRRGGQNDDRGLIARREFFQNLRRQLLAGAVLHDEAGSVYRI
jgi:hypothetical protein